MGNVAMCQPCNNSEGSQFKEEINKQNQGNLGIKKAEQNYPGGMTNSKIQKQQLQQSTVSTQSGGARDTFLKPFEEQFKKDSKINIDSFKLHRVLGKGSFGKVMLVEFLQTNKLYAMKILQKKSIKTERQKRHTQTERFVLEKMKHPFIIQLNFAFQNEEKLYLVLDFMNGGELFQHLQKQGRFKESVAQFYAAEILLAIEHLHDHNIFYRDLKPENVLMGEDGHIKIADFGLSFMTQDIDQYAKSMCGTPEYLAPEILLSKRGHDKTVDWWSLGSLIYEMLTGLPPFYSEDKKKMFQNVISKQIPMPSYLSAKAVSLLKQLLVVDPQKRLGYGVDGAKNIKNHPFFDTIDWDKLMRKEVESPLKFTLKGPEDLKYFDKHIIKQDAKDTPVQNNGIQNMDQNIAFSNFTYNGKDKLKTSNSNNQENLLMDNNESSNVSNKNKQQTEFQLDGTSFD